MAIVTKQNGTSQPVFNMDVANGSIAGATATAGTPVNAAGPKLDFFAMVANATVAAQQGTNGYVASVLQAVQQNGTVAMYQVDAAQISIAIYPAGAYTAATLAAAVQTANAAIGMETANVTTTGFKLATS
jgi:hypothetical protein